MNLIPDEDRAELEQIAREGLSCGRGLGKTVRVALEHAYLLGRVRALAEVQAQVAAVGVATNREDAAPPAPLLVEEGGEC